MSRQISFSFSLKSIALLLTCGFAAPSWAVFTCTTSGTPEIVLPITSVLGPAAPVAQGQHTFTYTCNRNGSTGRETRMCFHIGDGSGSSVGASSLDKFNPRILKNDTDGVSGIGFQIYSDAGRSQFWGTTTGTPSHPPHVFTPQVTRGISFGPFTDTISMYLRTIDLTNPINGSSTLATAAPGTYTSSFTGSHTVLRAAMRTISLQINSDCSPQGNGGDTQFPFTVKAVVPAECIVNGNNPIADIDFGTQAATVTNLQASTNLTMQCTRTTLYAIGLQPSAINGGDSNGAGHMKNASGDLVAYQLRQATGMGGAIWGADATPGVSGNGVQGVGLGGGAGNTTTHTIYATVASADAPAGNYQDTVTVTVNY